MRDFVCGYQDLFMCGLHLLGFVFWSLVFLAAFAFLISVTLDRRKKD